MEEHELDPGRLYGYAVCLVAVLTIVFACTSLAGRFLDFREPPYTKTYRDGPTLVSFGSYKMDVLSQLQFDGAGGAVGTLIPSDSTFRQMYEKERLYRLAVSHQVSRRGMAVNAVLLGVALLVFGSHWMWLRRRERPRHGGER